MASLDPYQPSREACPAVPSPRDAGHRDKTPFSGTEAGTDHQPIDINCMISAVFERDRQGGQERDTLSQEGGQEPLKNEELGTKKSADLKQGDNRELGTGTSPNKPSIRGDFGSQYPEDQEHWLEMKRIFGSSYPPAQDPLASYRPADNPRLNPAEVERFADDDARIRHMFRTGELSRDPLPTPHSPLLKSYLAEREAFLQAEERRQSAIRDRSGKSRPLRIALGYEGPSSARHRSFMTRNGLMIKVPRSAYLEHDSVRLLLHPNKHGDKVLSDLEAMESERSDPMTDFPGVHREPGLITVRCEPGYHPEVTLWSRRLVLDLERQGMRFDASASELIVTHDGDALDDEILGQVLPRTEIIKSTILERRTA